jgi:hypothetical protein
MSTEAVLPLARSTTSLDDVLRMMRRRKQHFVVVLGPSGGLKLVEGKEVLRALFRRGETVAAALRGRPLDRTATDRRAELVPLTDQNRAGLERRWNTRSTPYRAWQVGAKEALIWFSDETRYHGASEQCMCTEGCSKKTYEAPPAKREQACPAGCGGTLECV